MIEKIQLFTIIASPISIYYQGSIMAKKNSQSYLKYDFINKSIKFPETTEEKQQTEKQKTWIIYARVSTDEQKIKGNWISAQIIDCETWAKRNNVKIIHDPFVDEWISWTKLNRKWFIDAIEYIEKMNKDHLTIDYFICNSTSRFSRSHNISDTFDMVTRVNSAGAQLVAVWNGWIQDIDDEAWFLNFWLNSLMDAVESKRGQKRVRYWITWKIMLWYRPFWHTPVWYNRIDIKEWWQNLKILVVDEEKAPIIKSWLELFADWIILTKHDLFEYFKERWLKSNSKVNKSWELHPSIIDRILDLQKLLAYAWYITYPKRWINELIPAKHTPLIDMNTIDKIMIRLNKYRWIDHEKRAYDQDVDDYPLKRVLLCPECHKAVTKWKSKSHTWDYHHYYWCNTKWCKLFKKWLPRDKVHESVIEKLKEITPSKKIEKFFDVIFKEEWDAEKVDMKNANKVKEKELATLKEERNRIESILDNITDPNLFKKKEEQRTELNQRIEDLEYSMKDITFEKSEFQRNLNDAKTILFNPVAMWKYWDAEIKQLLIGVCFNNKIYYKKNQGCRTPEISPIYWYLASLWDKKTPNSEG